jgi:phosphatidylinositol kinase/protein kinase (PI-3  family)
MNSKKLPLWLVMENEQTDGEKVMLIFKDGDDIRQDLLTLQLIRIMD